MEKLNDTIIAISTGAGTGAISIVRMSGKDAVKIADQIFSCKNNSTPSAFETQRLTLGKVSTKNFCEQAMCVVFRAPKSYTGEDVVEFQCHGGTQIASGILSECVSLGARIAEGGEFTKRAFLNGKTTLASAEGMMDMINAESDAELRAGYSLLSGTLSKFAGDAQGELTDLLSEIEVSFDYPEETIEHITKEKIKSKLSKISKDIRATLKTAESGSLIKSGVNVLIVGRPNVGKSSLLNFLLSKERAIVTEIAGTTRDTIEETASIDGFKFNFIDTAGIQQTTDKVEQIGVEKAKALIPSANIILFLVDSSMPWSVGDEEIFDAIKKLKYLVVKTKSDLPTKCEKVFADEIKISTLTKSGTDELKAKLIEMAGVSKIDASSLIITNERHRAALARAEQNISRALEGLDHLSLDLISMDIKSAYTDLGEITGTTASDEIIDTIFKKFCLGK